MKTWSALVAVCAALVVALAGCGGASSQGSASSTGGGEGAKLFMIAAPPGDDFYYTIEEAAKREAARVGADLEVQKFTKWEAAAQTSVLNAAIAKNPDAIFVGPVDENALQTPLERAAERGIKIITYDTTTRDPAGVVETFVAGDIVALGRSAAETQLRLIDNKGTVFYQGTQPDQTFFNSLHQGWSEVMDKQPNVEQLPVVYSDWEPSKASAQMQTILTAHPDLAGGFAGIFVDQQGITPAIKRAGKTEQVKLVGVDGAPENVARLRRGELAALVSVKAADYGTGMVRSAMKATKGEELPAKTVIGQCVLTAENLDDPANKGCLYQEAQN